MVILLLVLFLFLHIYRCCAPHFSCSSCCCCCHPWTGLRTKTGGKGKGGRSAIERSGSVDSIMTTLSDTNSSVGGPSPFTASDTKSPHCATPTAGIGQPSAGGGGGGGVACSVVSSAGAVAAGGRSSSSSSSGVGSLPSALESPSKRSTGNLSTVSAASVGLASDISSCMYHYTAPERLSDKIVSTVVAVVLVVELIYK